MFVKPAEGRAPRCPYTFMRIPAEGQSYADHDPHIAQYLRCGDMVEADAPKAPDGEVAPFTFPADSAPAEAADPAAPKATAPAAAEVAAPAVTEPAESPPAEPLPAVPAAAGLDASHPEEGR